MVVVSVEDSIFFFKENGVICFKLRDYLWEDMVLMDFLWWGLCVVLLGGFVYVIGGYDGFR